MTKIFIKAKMAGRKATPSTKEVPENPEVQRLAKNASLGYEEYLEAYIQENFGHGIQCFGKGKERQTTLTVFDKKLEEELPRLLECQQCHVLVSPSASYCSSVDCGMLFCSKCLPNKDRKENPCWCPETFFVPIEDKDS